jgi:transposase
VATHDFPDPDLGKAIPYGIYDLGANTGWVGVGTDHDLAAGVGTVEACKRLGIGRKTGYRWRAENGGLPPARLPEPARSNRFLSLLDRQRIATLRRRGVGVRAIAAVIGRAPSTVSRELRRNTLAHDRGYDGDLAHARARQRARRLRRARLLDDSLLRAEVQAKLELEWCGRSRNSALAHFA